MTMEQESVVVPETVWESMSADARKSWINYVVETPDGMVEGRIMEIYHFSPNQGNTDYCVVGDGRQGNVVRRDEITGLTRIVAEHLYHRNNGGPKTQEGHP